MMASVETDQWLVRTLQNRISGPFPKARVQEMIQEGALGLQDEICHANHYWIYLHEEEEVKAQLGIDVPHPHIESDADSTQTDTDSDITRSDLQTFSAKQAAGAERMEESGTSVM